MNFQTPLKVVIEFDLSREADRYLMNVITQVKGAQARGEEVSLNSVINQIKSSTEQSNLVAPLEKAGKKLTEVTNELQSKLGEDERKLTTKERASVAAKAKWAKYRAEKAGLTPPPPAPRRKKKNKKDIDLKHAERLEASAFPMKDANEEVAFNGSNFIKKPAIPDGREIIEGTFDEDSEPDEEISDIQFSEEYRRGIHERARDFER